MQIIVITLVTLIAVAVAAVLVRGSAGPKRRAKTSRRSSSNATDHNTFSWFGSGDNDSGGGWSCGGDSGGGGCD